MFKAIKRALNLYSVPKLDYNALAEDAKYTPDFPHLVQSAWQPLFVYDEMQETYPYQHLLVGYKQKQVAFTLKKFAVWKKDLGRETIAIALNKEYINTPKAPLAPVKGTLYLLPPESFKAIDKHKLNTVQCQRILTNVVVPSRRMDEKETTLSKKVRNYMYPAWIHVGIDEFWDKNLSSYSHSPVNKYKANDLLFKEYYEFSRLEYGYK